jgi:hypothetical protein
MRVRRWGAGGSSCCQPARGWGNHGSGVQASEGVQERGQEGVKVGASCVNCFRLAPVLTSLRRSCRWAGIVFQTLPSARKVTPKVIWSELMPPGAWRGGERARGSRIGLLWRWSWMPHLVGGPCLQDARFQGLPTKMCSARPAAHARTHARTQAPSVASGCNLHQAEECAPSPRQLCVP